MKHLDIKLFFSSVVPFDFWLVKNLSPLNITADPVVVVPAKVSHSLSKYSYVHCKFGEESVFVVC